MRLLRTELYFDRNSLESMSPVPGVSIGWARWPNGAGLPADVISLPSTIRIPRGARADEGIQHQTDRSEEQFRLQVVGPDAIPTELSRVIGLALRGEPSRLAARLDERKLQTPHALIEYVLTQPIVIEHSPP